MRAFDHVVLCVADLEQARASFAALGFTLTPPAAHPFGTRNSLVQFAGRNFLELLAIGDRAAILPHEPPHRFSFAAFNAAFLERRGEGASMLVFAGADARADIAAFRAAGLDTYEPFDFGRDAIQPDGSVARVGFSLAFVTHEAMPDAAFFTCQHRHQPELFWRPEYQRHPNGAETLTGVVMSAANLPLISDFLERITSAMAAGDDAAAVRPGPRSEQVTILSADALVQRYPKWRGVGDLESPRFRALRVTVRDLAAVRDRLERRAVPHRLAEHGLVVPPAFAHGVCVEFSGG